MISLPLAAPELVVTNFHRRFTGVSATADAVVSQQQNLFRMCLAGRPLPSAPQAISYRQAISLCRKPPQGRPFAIWHVRRNSEMLGAIFARDILRLPIRIVFTSAAQRRHSAVPRRLIAKMDAVVATTAKAASFIPNVAAIVPHGVDTERFTPAADRQAAWDKLGYGGRYGIGIVGRVRPEKGTDLFVDALLRVLPARPDFTAVIIGRAMPVDSDFQRRLQQRIAAAGLTGRFIFTGEVPPQAMPSLMQSLSLLVAPARYEGYGMTPLEAMASGVAVVASETGVYPEIVQDHVGRLVPIGDADALSHVVAEITQNVESLHRKGQAARALAESQLSLRLESAGYAALMQRIWAGESVDVLPLRECQGTAAHSRRRAG